MYYWVKIEGFPLISGRENLQKITDVLEKITVFSRKTAFFSMLIYIFHTFISGFLCQIYRV